MDQLTYQEKISFRILLRSVLESYLDMDKNHRRNNELLEKEIVSLFSQSVKMQWNFIYLF